MLKFHICLCSSCHSNNIVYCLQLHYYKQGKHSDFEALLKAANAGQCLSVRVCLTYLNYFIETVKFYLSRHLLLSYYSLIDFLIDINSKLFDQS